MLSEIRLNGVPTSSRSSRIVDILIRIMPGHSPKARDLGRGVLEHSGEGWLIKVQGVADFEITGGQRIHVWPAPGVTQKEIEIFLFGPAWATLCHQRGLLPLHASAIVTGKGITAFAGPSGAGKSTTAALMGARGYELVTDDMLPVSLNRNLIPGAWPYLPRLKLQAASIIQLALAPAEPVSDSLDKEKYFVRPERVAEDKWRRLERLYLLEIDPTDSDMSIDRITGAEAVRVLVDQTYYFQFNLTSGQLGNHLALCTQLASQIAVYRVRRSSFGVGNDLGSLICEHLQNTAP
jgi:hypothetical protein